MRSEEVNIGDSILASQYNNLRKDAKGGSFLLAHEQATPDLTLYVEPGVCYVGATRVVFAGGNSPQFTAPTTNPRIDLLTINSSGVLERTVGTESATPSAPAYPADKLVICEVYNRVGQTAIRDTDVAGQGYIQRDVRPFLGGSFISSSAQFAANVVDDAAIASHETTKIIVPLSKLKHANQAQGDIIYHDGTNWTRLGAGISGQFLKTQGASANPVWASLTGAAREDSKNTTTNLTGTTAETTLATLTITGGKMGANGWVRIIVLWRGENTGGGVGTQELKVKLNGTVIAQHSRSSTSGGPQQISNVYVYNQGSASSQSAYNIHFSNNGSTPSIGNLYGGLTTYAFNTNNNVTVTVTGQLTNTSHNIWLDAVLIEIFPSA